MKAIVDASVAIKWFIPEEDRESAGHLRFSLVAPELMKIEVANALLKKRRQGEIDHGICEAILGALSTGAIRYVPDGELFEAAFRIARDIDRPVYDCLYLALAGAERGKVITANARLLGAAGQHGLERLVQPLAAI